MENRKKIPQVRMLQGALGLIILTFAIILLNERIANVKEAPAITAVEAAQTAVKINIERPGMYKITSDALKKLGLASWLKNPEDLKLYLRGVEQPFWVEGQGDSAVLLFYGTASESVYSSENVYWLTYGSRIREPHYRLDPLPKMAARRRVNITLNPQDFSTS